MRLLIAAVLVYINHCATRTLASGISVTSRSPVQIGRAGITLLLSGVWLTWDTAHAVPTIQLLVSHYPTSNCYHTFSSGKY